MKNLLIATAALEAGAGFALICFPRAASATLLGPVIPLHTTMSVQQIAGAALLTIGVASWIAHYDANSLAAKGIVGSMIIYNLGTVCILTMASFKLHQVGIALLPAVVVHSLMSIWCITSIMKRTKSS